MRTTRRPGGPNSLAAVKITTLPGAGTLTDNGVAVSAHHYVAWPTSMPASSSSRRPPNANGAGYASFTFQVEDNGGGRTA